MLLDGEEIEQEDMRVCKKGMNLLMCGKCKIYASDYAFIEGGHVLDYT